MHLEVRKVVDNEALYVYIIYGENNTRDRLKLWKELSDYKNVVGRQPWMMLGDFNVILNFSDHSNIKKVILDGIQEFRDCVEDIGM